MRTNQLLAAVVTLQAFVLVGQWVGQPWSPRAAHAELNLPNPGERQLQMVEELKAANAKLDRMIALMQGGDMQVKVVGGADAAK